MSTSPTCFHISDGFLCSSSAHLFSFFFLLQDFKARHKNSFSKKCMHYNFLFLSLSNACKQNFNSAFEPFSETETIRFHYSRALWEVIMKSAGRFPQRQPGSTRAGNDKNNVDDPTVGTEAQLWNCPNSPTVRFCPALHVVLTGWETRVSPSHSLRRRWKLIFLFHGDSFCPSKHHILLAGVSLIALVLATRIKTLDWVSKGVLRRFMTRGCLKVNDINLCWTRV